MVCPASVWVTQGMPALSQPTPFGKNHIVALDLVI